jgi:hypothetical protein
MAHALAYWEMRVAGHEDCRPYKCLVPNAPVTPARWAVPPVGYDVEGREGTRV